MRSAFLCILLALTIGVRASFAQSVHVSDDDPHWGETITISYTAPDTSQWAHPGPLDTLFCASEPRGGNRWNATVLPMHYSGEGRYAASFRVPDSVSELAVDVCTPARQYGFTEFTCRTRSKLPTPGYFESEMNDPGAALDSELALYPRDYALYSEGYDKARQLQQLGMVKKTKDDWKEFVEGLIRQLKTKQDDSPSWFLTMGGLESRAGHDSVAHEYYRKASQAQIYDAIYDDYSFWNHFYAPAMTPHGMVFPDRQIAEIEPLVARFPRTLMGRLWLQRSAYDTMISPDMYGSICKPWEHSHDVDVLLAIGKARGDQGGQVYDPREALIWIERAERASRNASGFYSGENIYGSMGRLVDILQTKANVLAALGDYDSAIAAAKEAEGEATDRYQKQEVPATLGRVYLKAGRIEDAKLAFAQALAIGTNNDVFGLKDLYDSCKEAGETFDQFSARLVKMYGGTVSLPTLPDFHYTTLDGKAGTLSGLRGKVVVIDCWFISCPGCVLERASLDSLADSFGNDTNIVFLSISTDGSQALDNYLQNGTHHFRVIPNGFGLCQRLGVTGFPTHIIVAPDGKTLGFEIGGSTNTGEQMRQKILAALASK